MTLQIPYLDGLDLHVEGRISSEEAARQERTAREILKRLEHQPGLILADEVGMGKTFVAMAVAASVALYDEQQRPVVVMVPPSLKEKWPRDFQLFREKCLPIRTAANFRDRTAETAVDFLKLLDDPEGKRRSLIFLSHGAMSRGLQDKWVKLALIYRALYKRKDIDQLRRGLCRILGRLLHLPWVDKTDPDVWEVLLRTDPESWLKILQKYGIDPEGDENPHTDDDPVPEAIRNVLWDLKTDNVFDVLQRIPIRESKYFDDRLADARRAINDELKELWKLCMKSLDIKLPLLILDEAHHLKNARTQLASLFQTEDAREDVDQISKGPLGGVFERMLFLTATPFQLGHAELCSVLERFHAIDWNSSRKPTCDKYQFGGQLTTLHSRLDAAQESALRLDNAWKKLTAQDLSVDGKTFEDLESWWIALKGGSQLTATTQDVLKRFEETNAAMRSAETALKPFVIRHLKPRLLPAPFAGIERRRRFVGRSILMEEASPLESGLSVNDASLLPFLLAARLTACTPESRPVFAEGLASSYEAFRHTRMMRQQKTDGSLTDTDDDSVEGCATDAVAQWYLQHLDNVLAQTEQESSSHPKVMATVNRAMDLWKSGEKVIVFCHYVATGRALRQCLSDEIRRSIMVLGAEKLRCAQQDVFPELERIGQRFFDVDSPLRRACDEEVRNILGPFKLPEEKVIDVVRRYLRTPSFLVRFFPLGDQPYSEASVAVAFASKDRSGLTLRRILTEFFDFLVVRCGEDERNRYMEAVHRIQTGSFAGADVGRTYGEDEIQGDRSERFVPNVRLVNGDTGDETRQRLMLTFNTPFFPEILIASAVMAEGVDLHLNCRYVIHHDLCWNPSTLEQRTGRVDRIGAKVERAGQPIDVFLPYIAETQDEKMYRVVMDRERWFKVVMGEQYKVDARSTDKLAERIRLPLAAAEALAFRLEV